MKAAMWAPVPAVFLLGVVAVAAAHAAPTSAIVGGLETSLLDGRLSGRSTPARPTTARLERVYSSSVKAKADKAGPGAARKAESYARTGNQVHLTPAGTPSENPAPCAVGGRHFLHGQQVTRPDPCEFCLCLDGEMFCWWQDCPPSTAQGPCRGRPAFSSCQDEATPTGPQGGSQGGPTPDPAAPPSAAAGAPAPSASAFGAVNGDPASSEQQGSLEGEGDAPLNETSTSAPSAAVPDAATHDHEATSRSQQTTRAAQPLVQPQPQDPTTDPQAEAAAALPGSGEQLFGTEAAAAPQQPDASSSAVTSTTASPVNASTTSVPATTELVCHVLGSTYRVGEVLPRDTGSCLQCECSPAGRVTCSPKDCLSVREEEDVYQPASSLDMFDVDSF